MLVAWNRPGEIFTLWTLANALTHTYTFTSSQRAWWKTLTSTLPVVFQIWCLYYDLVLKLLYLFFNLWLLRNIIFKFPSILNHFCCFWFYCDVVCRISILWYLFGLGWWHTIWSIYLKEFMYTWKCAFFSSQGSTYVPLFNLLIMLPKLSLSIQIFCLFALSILRKKYYNLLCWFVKLCLFFMNYWFICFEAKLLGIYMIITSFW